MKMITMVHGGYPKLKWNVFRFEDRLPKFDVRTMTIIYPGGSLYFFPEENKWKTSA